MDDEKAFNNLPSIWADSRGKLFTNSTNQRNNSTVGSEGVDICGNFSCDSNGYLIRPEKTLLCLTCKSQAINNVFFPCHHAIVCKYCAVHMLYCFLCGREIQCKE
jgi:hypothetical protein